MGMRASIVNLIAYEKNEENDIQLWLYEFSLFLLVLTLNWW